MHPLIPILLGATLLPPLISAAAVTSKFTRAIPIPTTILDPEPVIGIFIFPNVTSFFRGNDPNSPVKRGDGDVITPIPVSKPEPTNIYLLICDAANLKGNCVTVDFPNDGFIMRLAAGEFWDARIASLGVSEKGYCEVYAELTPKGSCGGSGGFIVADSENAQMDVAKEPFPGREFKPAQQWQGATREWDHLVKCVKCWRRGNRPEEKDEGV